MKVKTILAHNYKICFHAYNLNISENLKHDLHQRMDEICLIYSDCFEVSVNEAKEYLEKKSKVIMKKEDASSGDGE